MYSRVYIISNRVIKGEVIVDEKIKPNLCINLPMVLDKEKEQYSIKENIFQLEEGDILEVNINLYEAVSNSKFPKQLIISTKWGETLKVISEGVFCGYKQLEYKEGKNIVVPLELIDNKVCITFYLKVGEINKPSAEIQVGVNYTFLNKKTGVTDNIRFYSSKIYMDFMKCMPKATLSACDIKGTINGYQLCVENRGDITITDVRCHINIPEGVDYIEESLYINGEKPLYENCYKNLRLYDVSPGEKVNISFCVDSKNLQCNEDIYIDIEYTYVKQKKIKNKIRSNALPLGVNCIKSKTCEDAQISISQKVEVCKCGCDSFFRFTVCITKRKDVCISDCIMMYILYYRLKLIPNSLKVNEVYISGNIKKLKLKYLEGKCQKAEVKIQFDAKIRNEFCRGYILNPKFCSTSHLRVKYIDDKCRRKITPVSCVSSSQKCCENKVDLL